MAQTLALLAFRAARLPFIRPFVPRLFSMLNFAIPLKRLRETATLLAFYHPVPAYPVHILIVPQQPIPSLDAVGALDQAFLADVFATTQSLVRELQLEKTGYRLVVNGGGYQDIPMLHFHLISGAMDRVEPA